MKKIYLTLIIGLLLVGTVIGAITLTSKDITFEKEVRDYLQVKGIGEIEIINETDNSSLGYHYPTRNNCYDKGDLYICNLYQRGGIKKDISIIHTECLQYEWDEIEQINTTKCINLKVLSKADKEEA